MHHLLTVLTVNPLCKHQTIQYLFITVYLMITQTSPRCIKNVFFLNKSTLYIRITHCRT